MITLAGHDFEEKELLRRALRNLRSSPRRTPRVRWALVMETFGVGSTVARALCLELGMDPEELV